MTSARCANAVAANVVASSRACSVGKIVVSAARTEVGFGCDDPKSELPVEGGWVHYSG
jgi:hypothetical protein